MAASFRRLLALAVAAALLIAAVALLSDGSAPGRGAGRMVSALRADQFAVRDLEAYRGLGAWVDAFDYAPAYQSGGEPAVTPAAVDEMAEHGVRTLFLQASRNDSRSPKGLVDPALLGRFLERAHRHGMRVVGWYLPKFVDIETDLRLLQAVADFEVLGHRFDGVAVDIEFTEDVPDHGLRNQQLVELSRRFRQASGGDTVGAIVLPPVQLEVVNPQLWPDFPYRELAPFYDVWLPMSYWSFRRTDSGYQDGYTYNEESTRRLRTNLGNSAVPVHGIGGIGDEVTTVDLDRFVSSLVDTGSVGGSIYDWATLAGDHRSQLADAFGSGPAASLPQPP